MSTFSYVYKTVTFERVEVCGDKMLIPIHFHDIKLMFIIYIDVVLMTSRYEEGGSEKVYVLNTCENANIFWPIPCLIH